MAESPVKKVITDADEILFRSKRNEQLMRELTWVNQGIDKGYLQMNAAFLEIEIADPSKCVNFSRATCRTKRYERQPVALGSLFCTGVEVLKRFVESKEEECVPDDTSVKEALKKLFTFLSEEPPEELFKHGLYSECAWAVILAEHVFTKLIHGSEVDKMFGYYKMFDYKMDQYYSGSSSLQKEQYGPHYCACKNNEKISGAFCDTSFGCALGWHGSVDIVIENVAACVATGEVYEGEEEEYDDDGCSMVSVCSDSSEEEEGCKKTIDDQRYAQCIVFSFLQRENDSSLRNFLIPFLDITGNKVKIHFYDCENDILLKTAKLDLTSGAELRREVIVLLWLVLNYKLFCTGVPESLRSCKAKFFEKIGDKLRYYTECMRSGIGWHRKEVVEDEKWSRTMPERVVSTYP